MSVLAKLQSAGLTVRLDTATDRLIVRPASMLTAPLRGMIRAHRAEIVSALREAANDSPASHWRLTFADRDPLEVVTAPPMTRTDVMELCPSAEDAAPVRESCSETHSGPTSDEWAAVVTRLCALRGDDPENCQALLDDYRELSAENLTAWIGVFRAEIAAIAAAREEMA